MTTTVNNMIKKGYKKHFGFAIQVGQSCVDACVHMKQIDTAINGVTTYVDESKKGAVFCYLC